jgi:hypothetical protein
VAAHWRRAAARVTATVRVRAVSCATMPAHAAAAGARNQLKAPGPRSLGTRPRAREERPLPGHGLISLIRPWPRSGLWPLFRVVHQLFVPRWTAVDEGGPRPASDDDEALLMERPSGC